MQVLKAQLPIPVAPDVKLIAVTTISVYVVNVSALIHQI
jgi:hypothetical protein